MLRARRTLVALSIAATLATVPGTAAAGKPAASGPPDREVPRGEPVGVIHSLRGSIVSQATPSGSVDLVSGLWYVETLNNQVVVIGEVMNGMSTRRKDVTVYVEFYDSGDKVIGEGSGNVRVGHLAPGMTGPFRIAEAAPPGIVDVGVWVEPGSPAGRPSGALRIALGAPHTTGDGSVHYPGTVTNRASFAIYSPVIVVARYDGTGTIVDFTDAFASGGDSIPPGGSSPFEAQFSGDDGVSRVAAVTQASPYDDIASTSYVTSWNNYFDDIGFSAFRSDIIWNAEQEIASGCGTALYCPSGYVTREQMASFLARALKLTGTAPDAFTDDESSLHEPNINLVAKAGIATGCAAGQVLSDRPRVPGADGLVPRPGPQARRHRPRRLHRRRAEHPRAQHQPRREGRGGHRLRQRQVLPHGQRHPGPDGRLPPPGLRAVAVSAPHSPVAPVQPPAPTPTPAPTPQASASPSPASVPRASASGQRLSKEGLA